MHSQHAGGPRIEFDMVSHMYTIYRPAAEGRDEVEYTATEFDVMRAIAANDEERHYYTRHKALELLMHNRYDVILYPVRRREAIEHTRRLHGN